MQIIWYIINIGFIIGFAGMLIGTVLISFRNEKLDKFTYWVLSISAAVMAVPLLITIYLAIFDHAKLKMLP